MPVFSTSDPGNPGRFSSERTWGLIMILPYSAVFLLFAVYPLGYGFWLGRDPESYRTLWNNPVFVRTFQNTLIFLAVSVNIKMVLALFLSGIFAKSGRWVRWLGLILILPWAVPSVPAILSFRWLLNSEWGMLNTLLFEMGISGPPWLVRPNWALGAICMVHIWKYMPFWVIVMTAGRMAIPKPLYEAAEMDGADRIQKFVYITWPGLRNLYIINTLVATTWALGDFNTIYLLTGGGPVERTHTLATLGFRYAFILADIRTGVATAITVFPMLIPLLLVLMRHINRRNMKLGSDDKTQSTKH